MGTYNTYGRVQLKVDPVSMREYIVGEAVPIPDGAYVGYEGVVVIAGGIFTAWYAFLHDKYGNQIDLKELIDKTNPVAQVIKNG